MKTDFKRLTPAQAWDDAQRRSLAIGIAGWALVGSLQAGGAIPTLYRPSLAPASGLVTAFLTALALCLAYYHSRWKVGACAALITLCLPYTVSVFWVRFSDRSLLYPLATLVVVVAIALFSLHRKYSGPALEDDAESMVIEMMMADFHPTWMDRVTALCFVVGLVLLLILLLR